MSEYPLDPLPPELGELFESERRRGDPDSAVAERVFTRAALSLGLGGGGGPGTTGSGEPGVGASGGASAGTSAGTSAGARSGAIGAVGGGAGSLGAKSAWVALSAFALGGLSGAGLHAVLAPRAEPRVEVVRVPVSVSGSAVVAKAPAVSEGVKPEDLPIEAHPSATSSGHAKVHEDAGRAEHDDDLTAERELLAIARTAVARGQGEAALSALGRHARQFPRGRLAEERESLRIQALVAAGRTDEARDRARDFGKQFPNSLQKKAIETSIGEP